jgi:hypothetical protein
MLNSLAHFARDSQIEFSRVDGTNDDDSAVRDP